MVALECLTRSHLKKVVLAFGRILVQLKKSLVPSTYLHLTGVAECRKKNILFWVDRLAGGAGDQRPIPRSVCFRCE
ncbi:hypothetical protein Hdeb2414_s0006g00193861 [Helianthus debilis subsp. tardiflorus]